MPEIFQPEKFAQRLKFKIIDDFSYLFLMTDGIYDPKFGVESMLEKAEAWQHLLTICKEITNKNVRSTFRQRTLKWHNSYQHGWTSGVQEIMTTEP
jgi:hypothetical protein